MYAGLEVIEVCQGSPTNLTVRLQVTANSVNTIPLDNTFITFRPAGLWSRGQTTYYFSFPGEEACADEYEVSSVEDSGMYHSQLQYHIPQAGYDALTLEPTKFLHGLHAVLEFHK